MSSRSVFFIYCDEPGCAASFSAGLKSGWVTRDAAKKEGWMVIVPERPKRVGPAKSLDFCPTHSSRQAFPTNGAGEQVVTNQEGK